MKKKKKKPTGHDIKVIDAHHRNEYLVRVRKLLDEMGVGDAYPKFSPKLLNLFYTCRGQFLQLKVGEENKIRSIDLKKIQMLLYNWCKDAKMPVDGKDYSMKLIDFHEIWYTMIILLKAIKQGELGKKFNVDPEIFDIFNLYLDFENDCLLNQLETSKNELTKFLTTFALFSGNISQQISWLEIKEVKEDTADDTADEKHSRYWYKQLIVMHALKPEIFNFVSNNSSRPAYRVGVPVTNTGIQWATIAPKVWGGTGSDADTSKNVYIQSHAIMRMQERIDGLKEQMCIFYLVMSLIENPVAIVRDKNLLIEYRIDGLKIGYLVASQQKNNIIIRTFLFITSNGTPEGKILSEITGLGKLDKKYLAIDKLSSFVASDISRNPKVADIFLRAGCADLLKTDKMFLSRTINESTFSSDFMLKYLNQFEPKTNELQLVEED